MALTINLKCLKRNKEFLQSGHYVLLLKHGLGTAWTGPPFYLDVHSGMSSGFNGLFPSDSNCSLVM
jgi:hypothetical protein